MPKITNQLTDPLHTLAQLRATLVHAGTSAFALAPPALYGLGAALCEVASLALLVPLTQGLIERDFSFVEQVPVLKQIVPYVLGTPIQSDLRTILFLVALIFMAAAGKFAMRALSTTATRRQVSRLTGNLRKAVHARYLRFGQLYFDSRNRGQLQEVLTSHVMTVARGLDSLQGAFYAGFSLLGYLALMGRISWLLTLLVLLLFPILHLSVGRLVRKTREASSDHLLSFSRLARNISNTLSAIPLIKAYRTESLEQQRFEQMSNEVEENAYRRDSKSMLVIPLQEFVLTTCLLLLLTAVGVFVLSGEVGSVAPYAVFLLALRRSGRSLGGFNNLRANLAAASGSLQEILSIFTDEGKYQIPDGSEEFVGLRTGIRTQGLEFQYPTGVVALRDLDVSFERGKVTAVVGRSGSGKSTLIHLLMRYYDSPPGTIFVDGKDLRDLTLTSWRSSIALVSQDTFLFDATLRENLAYGFDSGVSDEDLQAAIERSNLQETMSRLPDGLDTEIGDRGVKLSGGERQRVAVARAILKDAEILLLDEATSALDSRTERAIQEALAELTVGRTTIVVAHRLSTIQHADKIVVLEDGTLVEEGTFAELITEKSHFHAYCREQRFDVEEARRGAE